MAAMMPLMNFLDEGKFVQKIKHGCELAGLKAGAPRLPLLPLDAERGAGARDDRRRAEAGRRRGRLGPQVEEPVR